MSEHGQPSRLKVGLVEITGFHWTRRTRQEWTIFGGALRGRKDPRAEKPSSFHFLPYSVGLLQAYAQKHAARPERYEFLLPLYRRLPVEEAVEHLLEADVVGISTYCWNIRLSLAVARRLKERRPEVVIVAGGPQVPDHSEQFLRENPCIDVVCNGEGEATFLEILERSDLRHWEGIAGVSYLDRDGGFVSRPRLSRIADLEQIPSPYLTGVFEPLIAAQPNENWQLIWETNRGCPFSCTFCDWGSAIASKVYQFGIDRLKAEIEWMADHRIGFIFCADANFGILPRDLDLAEFLAETKKQRGYPLSMGVQSTKNATERAYKVQTLMSRISTTGVTIALQSTDPATLDNIKRGNISQESFRELQRRYTRDKVETYTDMILGLPGETYDSLANGASALIENGQHNRIQFYNCYILPNAEMAAPAYRKKFGMETVLSRMSDPHDPLQRPEWEVDEYLELVVATHAMPRPDWVRTKAFAFAAETLYFNRLAQVPFVVCHEQWGLSYREMIELPATADPQRYPVLAWMHQFFLEHARAIQQGGEEYVASERWLGVRWPASQLALIECATSWRIEALYAELAAALEERLVRRGVSYDPVLLREAVRLNEGLLRMAFEIDDLELELTHNVWEYYQGVVEGSPVPLERRPARYLVERTRPVWFSWEDWCEDVIARFNKKGAYLYPLRVTGEDPATLPLPRPDAGIIRTHVVQPAE